MNFIKVIGVTLSMISLSLFCQNKSPEGTFWKWFVENQDTLYHFEKNQDMIFNNLANELHKIHPHLTFEFGPEINNQREFVISAGGIKDAFPSVIALAKAAPSLPQWKITKFRPRREEISSIIIDSVSVSPDDVLFSLEEAGGKANLVLFIGDDQNYDRNIYGNIGFLFLDQILGEYDVEMFVGSIDFRPVTDSPHLMKAHLSELRSTFDRLLKRKIN
jgi:hypothetical protein